MFKPNPNEEIKIFVPWSGKIVEVSVVLSDYDYEVWEAVQAMKIAHKAKFEGIIKLKSNSPQNRATEMLHQVSASNDRLAFFIV